MKLYGNDDKKFILILNGDKNKPSGLDGMSYEKYISIELFGCEIAKEFLKNNHDKTELVIIDNSLSRDEKCSMMEFIKDSLDGADISMVVEHIHKVEKVISVFTYQSMLNNITPINDDLWNERKRRIAISGHLSDAIKNNEISMWLQPQCNHTTGEIIGVEALCRWNHIYLGYLQPSEFINILEEDGNIFELDAFIWETACRYMKKWLEQGYKMPISVNISRKDILHTDLVKHFTELVKKYNLPPEMLRLEITESSYMDDSSKITDLVTNLKEQGFIVEMDDFGSGYSSLSMLQDVPIDILKLDMGFLRKTNERVRGGSIINAIIKMAHALDIGVVAEGVETIEQANFLKNLGCAYMQGYYFSKPITAAEFEEQFLAREKDELKKQYDKYDFYKLQELLDAQSNSSFIFNYCMGPAALFEYDGNTARIIIINDAVYNLLGIERGESETYRRDLFEAFSEKTSNKIKKLFDTAIENGSSTTEFVVPVNNQKQYIQMYARFISSSNTTALLIAELENITNERNLANKLEKLQSEMQAHMDLMPGGVFRYEADGNHNFAYVSRSLVDLLGYGSTEEFLNKVNNNFVDYICEEDRQRIQDEINEQMQKTDEFYCEYRVLKADGSLLWLGGRRRLVTDEDGKRWFYVVVTNITKMKEIQLEKKWHDEKINALLNVSGVFIYDYDNIKDRMTMEVNAGNNNIKRLVSENYLASLKEKNWIDSEYVNEYIETIKRVSSEVCSQSVYVKALTSDGTYKPCKFYFTSIADDNGNVYRVVGRAEAV